MTSGLLDLLISSFFSIDLVIVYSEIFEASMALCTQWTSI